MGLEHNQKYTLGVDIGGTKIETALVDASGSIIASHYSLIDIAKDPSTAVKVILDSVQACYRESGEKALAMGVGVAGQINKTNGIVHSSPNLPLWKDVPLSAMLQEGLQIPVAVNNDVRVITWGEWHHGAGRHFKDLICLFIGTGVGGGVVSGGRLLEGHSNTAGELGHMIVKVGGRKCHCPNKGCLEAYCGGWAIAERAREAVKRRADGKLLVELAGNLESITAVTVSVAYSKGDPLAKKLVKDTANYLAAGLESIINIFNPELIILGGSVIQGIPDLITLAEKKARSMALPTPARDIHVTRAALGNKAGVIGAAVLARNII